MNQAKHCYIRVSLVYMGGRNLSTLFIRGFWRLGLDFGARLRVVYDSPRVFDKLVFT